MTNYERQLIHYLLIEKYENQTGLYPPILNNN